MKDANKMIFRSSGSGYIMGDAKSKDELLPETAKTNLIDLYVSQRYGRREQLKNKYLKKGNKCEEDSVTLFSRVSKILFKKNDVRLTNDYVTGEPDLFIGKSIRDADETFDTKTSWSAHTFFRAMKDPLNKNYYWQGQCYMWLTGAKKHTVVYCLVNGLASAILDEKRKLSYEQGMLDEHGNESEEFKKQARQIEINHIYDIELFRSHNPWFDFHNDPDKWEWDIPMQERVYSFSFDRKEEDIEKLKARIRLCRNWINRELFKL